jgi:hypothetical protein
MINILNLFWSGGMSLNIAEVSFIQLIFHNGLKHVTAFRDLSLNITLQCTISRDLEDSENATLEQT